MVDGQDFLKDVAELYAQVSQEELSTNVVTSEEIQPESVDVDTYHDAELVDCENKQSAGKPRGIVPETLRALVNEGDNPVKADTMHAQMCRVLQRLIRKTSKLHGFRTRQEHVKALHRIVEAAMKAPGPFDEGVLCEMSSEIMHALDELQPMSQRNWDPTTTDTLTRPPKNHNKAFLKAFYSVPAMKRLYRLYTQLLFKRKDPTTLCRRFHQRCCKSEEHVEECWEKWAKVELVMKDLFVEQLFSPDLAKGKQIVVTRREPELDFSLILPTMAEEADSSIEPYEAYTSFGPHETDFGLILDSPFEDSDTFSLNS